jgi:hypothetical protein
MQQRPSLILVVAKQYQALHMAATQTFFLKVCCMGYTKIKNFLLISKMKTNLSDKVLPKEDTVKKNLKAVISFFGFIFTNSNSISKIGQIFVHFVPCFKKMFFSNFCV